MNFGTVYLEPVAINFLLFSVLVRNVTMGNGE